MESSEGPGLFNKRQFEALMNKQEQEGNPLEDRVVRNLMIDMCEADHNPGFSFSVEGKVAVTGGNFIVIQVVNIQKSDPGAPVASGDLIELLLSDRSFEGSTSRPNELPVTISDPKTGQMKAQRRAFVQKLVMD